MHNVDYGEDYEYASTRLSGTIIRHDGWPVYVHGINYETGELHVTHLLKQIETRAPLEEFDLSPVPLGFINFPTKFNYASRSPSRYYKQGLTSNVLRSTEYIPFTGQHIAKTIKGIYPCIMECAELIANKECTSRAFSRKFGLFNKAGKGTFGLKYIKRDVGTVTINQGASSFNLHLNDEYEYLKENLEEAVNA